jgi:hypothetical protein
MPAVTTTTIIENGKPWLIGLDENGAQIWKQCIETLPSPQPNQETTRVRQLCQPATDLSQGSNRDDLLKAIGKMLIRMNREV